MPTNVQLEKLTREFKEFTEKFDSQAEGLGNALANLKEALNSQDQKRIEAAQKEVDKFSLKNTSVLITCYIMRKNRLNYVKEIDQWNTRREIIQKYSTVLQLFNSRVESKDDGNKKKGHLYLESKDTVKYNADGKVDPVASRINGKENLTALLTELKGLGRENGCEINLDNLTEVAGPTKGVKYLEVDKEHRDRLIDPIKHKLDDLQLDNSMGQERMQQFVTEYFEVNHFARAIHKAEHEANQQAARGIAGAR